MPTLATHSDPPLATHQHFHPEEIMVRLTMAHHSTVTHAIMVKEAKDLSQFETLQLERKAFTPA